MRERITEPSEQLAFEQASSEPPTLPQMIGQRCARVALRTVLPLAGAVTGAYLMMHGAHYRTEVDNMPVEISTNIGDADSGLSADIALRDGAYPQTDLGTIQFPDFLRPLPLNIHISAYPGAEAVQETIVNRYDYARSIKVEAEKKAHDAAGYFLERAGIGIGGGLLAGVGMSESIAAYYRRNRESGNHPLVAGLGHSALAVSILIGAGVGVGSYIKLGTGDYQADGLIGAGLSSPNGFSNMHVSSPVLESILQDFQKTHACPEMTLPQEVPDDSIVITTYNVKSGQYGVGGIVQQLQASGSSVIFLQEVTPTVLDALASELDMQAIPGWTIENSKLTYGDAILTSLSVESTDFFRLPSGNLEQRGLLTATLESPVDGKQFIVADTHLTNEEMLLNGDKNAAVRQDQAEAILGDLKKLQEKDEPVILAGDFNVGTDSQVYDTLTKKYKDMVAKQLGDAASFPANGQRFDNILASTGKTVSANLGGGDNSDHCALRATLQITGTRVTPPLEAAKPAAGDTTPIPTRPSN